MRKFAAFYNSFQQALGASEEIFKFMDAVDDVQEKKRAFVLKGFSEGMRFENVGFAYASEEGETKQVLQGIKHEVAYEDLRLDDKIGKIALVGAGMKSHPGVSARFFGALADAGINIEMISTSEIRVSAVMRADMLDEAVRAVHSAFGLDSADEAIVYGGTGR